MDKISTITNFGLLPYEEENYDIALKNYVLFSKYNEEVHICLNKKYFDISFDYLSKLAVNYPILYLCEESFDSLYNKVLELKNDKQLQSFHTNQDEIIKEDDDFNIAEFLRTGSDILTTEDSAPIIKLVNSLFYNAVKQKASDLHIETHQYKAKIRFRIDGVLIDYLDLDKKLIELVISRIKVISNLNISEKRVPQDGRTQVTIATKVLDIRISILPTFYGEKVVMRILMQSSEVPSLNELGFQKHTIDKLEKLLVKSYGMILISGPTGSGKSTTLHALLQKIESKEKNIVTIEDPIEYKSDNINQIQVNNQVGLTFANGLRSILRQDPDIIMIGEIRDQETASIAIQAALTGHLMFSTLHTNRATAGVTRLIDMGIEKFLITSSLLAIVSQRLIRQLCVHCKEIDNNVMPYAQTITLPKDTILYKAKGCDKCNHTGYSKRVAIEEIFVLDDVGKELIKNDVHELELQELAIKQGMISLEEQINKMLIKGETSILEALRIGVF